MKTISVTTVTVGTATSTLTSNGTAPADGSTVTIGTKVYTFKTTLGTTEGQVLIGGSAANALANLKKALNADTADGTHPSNTKYYCAAANADVTGGAVDSTTLVVTSRITGIDGHVATSTTSGTLSWTGTALSGGAALTIVGTVADATPSAPSQQVTVPEYPTNNKRFVRQQRLTNTQLQCLKAGTGVALTLTEWSKVAMALENDLTYAPKILTQPAAASCVHNSTAATFTVEVSSELATAETYLWQYSADGSTGWTTASGTTAVYTGGTTATLTATPTATTHNGYYLQCLITNAVGTTTSVAVQITIT